jgi:hypothetical protein
LGAHRSALRFRPAGSGAGSGWPAGGPFEQPAPRHASTGNPVVESPRPGLGERPEIRPGKRRKFEATGVFHGRKGMDAKAASADPMGIRWSKRERKIMKSGIRGFAGPLFAVSFGLMSCNGATFRMDSDWRAGGVRIDGSDAEWQNGLAFVESAGVSLGAFNDADNLYLCLVTTDVSIERRIRMGGLTVWLDAAGKGGKKFGIRFPAGRPDGPGGPPGMEGRPEGRGPGRMETAEDREARREEMEKAFEAMQSSVEVLGPGEKDRREIPLSRAGDLEARIGMENGRFVYELKVPRVLSQENPVALSAGKSAVVSARFETRTFEPSRGGRSGYGGGPGGGGPPPEGSGGMDRGGFDGGPGGGPAGGMDGGPEGGRRFDRGSEKTLQIRVDLRLAEPAR